MNEEQTEKAVLKYLNSDNSDEQGPFRSLTTIFEKVVGPLAPHADSYDVDDEMETTQELNAILNQMVSDGLLETEWGERAYEGSYRLTDHGSYEASGFDPLVAEVPNNALVSESGEPITTEESDNIEIDEQVETDDLQVTIDSSTWTGLSRVRVTHRNARAISRLISTALDELDVNGNASTAQARTLLLAAKDLTEAPEPPSDIIWDLIQRAGAVVGLLDIFLKIFWAAANASTN